MASTSLRRRGGMVVVAVVVVFADEAGRVVGSQGVPGLTLPKYFSVCRLCDYLRWLTFLPKHMVAVLAG